jgi:putative transposase
MKKTRMSPASEAKAIFCYIAVRLIGRKGTEVGNYLRVGPSGISRAVMRGEQLMQKRQVLKKTIRERLNQ